MNVPESFGSWLRQRRKVLDLTQEELAQRVGCSVSAIRKIESDERRPSRQVTELLAAALQISDSERVLFVKVARGERSFDRLAALSNPPPLSLPSLEHSSQPAPVPAHPALNLPSPATPMVGRERELGQLIQLLQNPECRLLTMTGPGGVGKTRLAIQAARQITTEIPPLFPDGIFFASLAPVNSPDFMVAAIAEAVGFSFYGSKDPQTQLLTYLKDKTALLVLDNLEHLLEGMGLVAEILQNTPDVKLLTTSRERLNLIGEWVFEIYGLPLPSTETVTSRAEKSPENSSALSLFLQSAQRVRPGFELNDSNRVDIIQICQLMDGMPLGIELAASWVRVLSCREIVQEIRKSFDFLETKVRNLPSRHRSLRAAFEHSWNLLSESEQRALRRLSVFRGGFQREAAQEVAGASLSVLLALVDKSLLFPAYPSEELPMPGLSLDVRVSTSSDGRYDMLEVVRQFASQNLQQSQEEQETRNKHLAYYLSWVESIEPLLWGPQQATSLDRLGEEYNNLRAALEWSQENSDCAEKGLRLSASLWRFWSIRCYFQEGREWLSRTRSSAISAADEMKAKALNGEGLLAWRQGESATALALTQESARLQRQKGNLHGLAHAQALLGLILGAEGQTEQARSLVEESITLFRQAGDSIGLALSLNSLGELARSEGKNREAGALYQEGLALFRQLGHQRGVADLLHNLGYVAYHEGELEKALALFRESLVLERAQRNRRGIAECWMGMAGLIGAHGYTVQAVQLFAAAANLMESLGAVLEPTDLAEYEHNLEQIRLKMDPNAFAQAWQSGHLLTLEQALEIALQNTDEIELSLPPGSV